MTRLIVISVRTEADLAEAFAWYNHIRPSLGDDLIFCFEEALDRILDHPAAFPTIQPGVRRAIVHRFPYGVFFRVRETRIEVEAFFHLRVSPARLTDRLISADPAESACPGQG
jgi:toxin ParE1/3/4